MNELSSHLDRDKERRDWIGGVLRGWGEWRAKADNVLSTGSQSPIAGIIGENSGKLYKDNKDREKAANRAKYKQIVEALIKLGYKWPELGYQAKKELREWKIKKSLIPQPKETINLKPKVPGYNGHKYYAKIDKLVSQVSTVHRYILIKKYEFQWEIKDFMNHKGWKYNTTKTYIYDAKQELKDLFKKA